MRLTKNKILQTILYYRICGREKILWKVRRVHQRIRQRRESRLRRTHDGSQLILFGKTKATLHGSRERERNLSWNEARRQTSVYRFYRPLRDKSNELEQYFLLLIFFKVDKTKKVRENKK